MSMIFEFIIIAGVVAIFFSIFLMVPIATSRKRNGAVCQGYIRDEMRIVAASIFLFVIGFVFFGSYLVLR